MLVAEVSVLRQIVAGCPNRGESGEAKKLEYGGTVRARIASQCKKFTVRTGLRGRLPETAEQTRHLDVLLRDTVLSLAPDIRMTDELEKKIIEKAESVMKKEASADSKKAVRSFSPAEVHNYAVEVLADQGIEIPFADERPTMDQLLFGTMVASNRNYSVDAACQVEHIFSVDPLNLVEDYFMASDSVLPTEGAAHLATRELYSNLMYEYANVNISELMKPRVYGRNGEKRAYASPEQAVDTAVAFVSEFIMSVPSGGINGAAQTRIPTAVLVTVRDTAPSTLYGAFDEAVTADEEGSVAEKAKKKLLEEEKRIESFLGKPLFEGGIGFGKDAEAMGVTDFETLDALEKALKKELCDAVK